MSASTEAAATLGVSEQQRVDLSASREVAATLVLVSSREQI